MCSKRTDRSSKRCSGARRARRRQDSSQEDHAMASQPDLPEVKLDPASLYQEDVFTDRRAGTIRRLKPITADGSADPSRATLFSGQTQLLTPAGVLPLGFDIEAATLQEAIDKFPEGVK